MNIARFVAIAALAGLLSVTASAAWADIDDNIVDLGTLGGEDSVGLAINDVGQVAGVAQIPDELGGDYRAFLYDHGTILNLGTIDDDESAARDLNNSGQVIGYAGDYGFLYAGGVMTNLGKGEAWDINEGGQVVGFGDSAGQTHAFVYSGGVKTDLGTLGGTDSYAYAINEAGQVAGYSDTATQRHAFRYSAGVMSDLGTLGGSLSLGFAINEAGDVAGSSWITGDSESHAILWKSSDNIMHDLGTLGGTYSNASRVNASGQVAGESLIVGDTEYHAFLYSNGVMIDLSTPGMTWPSIGHLSDAGEVLFTETDPDTFERRAWYYKDGIRKPIGTLNGVATDVYDMNSSGSIVGSTWPPTPADGPHAFMTACPLLPSTTCNAGTQASIQIRNNDDDELDQLKWRWEGGSAVVQDDLGTPRDGTSYALCLYDSTSNVDSLVSVLRAAGGDEWHDRDPRGWSYRDMARAQDGIGKLLVKTGADGAPKARLDARGSSIPMPVPANASEMLDNQFGVTLQLMNDSTAMCWTSEFTAPTTNTHEEYAARIP